MNAVFFKSLRLRFLFAAFLWVSIATVVAGFVISGLYRAHLTTNFQDELHIHLVELVRLAQTDDTGHPMLDRPLSDPRFQEGGSGFYWQIEREGFAPVTSAALASTGKLLVSTFTLEPREKSGWMPGPVGEVLLSGILAPAHDGGPPLRFSIAAERHILEGIIAGFNRDLSISLMVFAALMVTGAMLQIRYGLQPARFIADSIEKLRQGKTARLPAEVPTEFSAIVSRLNALLDSQAAMVQRARVETGNLAHGLRTPLALIGDEAEQLEARGETEAAAFIQAQCRKIRRQVDYYMMRASAAGARTTGYVANLSSQVRQIIGAMERLYAGRNLTFIVDIPATITVNCDEGDLAEIMSNLIDNACKWAARTITVSAHTISGGVVIDIQDDGPGIAPDMRSHVFDVGTRLDESKTGSGLGLAISRDLARLYGGDLSLKDGDGGGLVARLSLPEAGA
jgi:signal transduction histidine kinase